MTGVALRNRQTFSDHLVRFVLDRNRSEEWFGYPEAGSEQAVLLLLEKFFVQVAHRVPETELQNRSWKEAERNTLMLFKSIAHRDSLGSPQEILESISQNYTVNLRQLAICPLWPFC